ncbi:hypothetical protein FA10DRAFT_282026 [Acaromyces ingoldii]|uniref:Uncharacterized protein n=1 Tax=Acaromyces ingoldii TaxID=215250 RepID=A0A316YG95_9BASI|nr:hypothetical protein FA10DRAFT_282026 [Acaromyces ingoldii]PWN86775.1 hypothetical protein FA10DRAFT_282026 [Acaromyces ingoldii]
MEKVLYGDEALQVINRELRSSLKARQLLGPFKEHFTEQAETFLHGGQIRLARVFVVPHQDTIAVIDAVSRYWERFFSASIHTGLPSWMPIIECVLAQGPSRPLVAKVLQASGPSHVTAFYRGQLMARVTPLLLVSLALLDGATMHMSQTHQKDVVLRLVGFRSGTYPLDVDYQGFLQTGQSWHNPNDLLPSSDIQQAIRLCGFSGLEDEIHTLGFLQQQMMTLPVATQYMRLAMQAYEVAFIGFDSKSVLVPFPSSNSEANSRPNLQQRQKNRQDEEDLDIDAISPCETDQKCQHLLEEAMGALRELMSSEYFTFLLSVFLYTDDARALQGRASGRDRLGSKGSMGSNIKLRTRVQREINPFGDVDRFAIGVIADNRCAMRVHRPVPSQTGNDSVRLLPLAESVGGRPIYIIAYGTFFLFFLLVALARNIQTVFVARFLCGAAGSVGATMVEGTLSDIWTRGEPHLIGPFGCAGLPDLQSRDLALCQAEEGAAKRKAHPGWHGQEDQSFALDLARQTAEGSVPLVFAQYVIAQGPSFVGMAIDALIGFAIHLIYVQRSKRQAGSTPETRLGEATGFFFYAWTGLPQLPWIVPQIASACITVRRYSVYACILIHLSECYGLYTSSALAAQSFLRNVFATTFPLFAADMYRKLTYRWASTLLCFLAATLALFPFLLVRYGNALRERSPFATKQILAQLPVSTAHRRSLAATERSEISVPLPIRALLELLIVRSCNDDMDKFFDVLKCLQRRACLEDDPEEGCLL